MPHIVMHASHGGRVRVRVRGSDNHDNTSAIIHGVFDIIHSIQVMKEGRRTIVETKDGAQKGYDA